MNLLYDFYGQLLTKKQRAFFDLYYQADLSLGEIASQHDVTRQAVYDILKRSERALESFESKLKLVERHLHGAKSRSASGTRLGRTGRRRGRAGERRIGQRRAATHSCHRQACAVAGRHRTISKRTRQGPPPAATEPCTTATTQRRTRGGVVLFSNLAEKLQTALGKLRGRGKLTEKDVDVALREVRLALLEADVNFRVVKDFVARVKERAVGEEVMQS